MSNTKTQPTYLTRDEIANLWMVDEDDPSMEGVLHGYQHDERVSVTLADGSSADWGEPPFDEEAPLRGEAAELEAIYDQWRREERDYTRPTFAEKAQEEAYDAYRPES